MPESGQENQGLVTEILKKGDLSTGEIKEELWARNVSFVRSYDRIYSGLLSAIAVLWLLPAIAGWSGWGFLNIFARLPQVDFPVVVVVIVAIFFIAAISLEVKVNVRRQHQGGCHDMHETVVVVREGPYRVIRHPGYLAEIVYFGLLPILLSKWVPFTILAAISIAIIIASFAYLVRAEDNFNIKKWGGRILAVHERGAGAQFRERIKELENESQKGLRGGLE